MNTQNTEKIVMSREQVRKFDQWAINKIGIPGSILMENAGGGAARILMELYPEESNSILILCGCGNNGGDGFVVARHLLNEGYQVEVVVLGSVEKIKGDAKVMLESLRKISDKLCSIVPNSQSRLENLTDRISHSTVVVDAIFGTGFKGELRSGYGELFSIINDSGKEIFAIDIPSGLDCDLGIPLCECVKSRHTATFVAIKKGFQNPAAQAYTGEVSVVSIGVAVQLKPRKG